MRSYLHESYQSEIIIKKEGELLRLRYANKDPEEFRLEIRNCRRAFNSKEHCNSIHDILNFTFSRVIARFLNESYAKLDPVRQQILTVTQGDIKSLRQNFEDNVLLNKAPAIKWLNDNLLPVQINETTDLWNRVNLKAESYAVALLFGYFSELLYNVFKYAEPTHKPFLTLNFGEKVSNEQNYLYLSWHNAIANEHRIDLGRGKGLDAIRSDLEQLNDNEDKQEVLSVSVVDMQYQATLYFKQDILLASASKLTSDIKRKIKIRGE